MATFTNHHKKITGGVEIGIQPMFSILIMPLELVLILLKFMEEKVVVMETKILDIPYRSSILEAIVMKSLYTPNVITPEKN